MLSQAGRLLLNRSSSLVPHSRIAAPTLLGYTQKRFLNIHEYSSHELMKKYGINTPQSGVATTPIEAYEVAQGLDSEDVVVKAQILAGGRGLGKFTSGLQGGVHIVDSADEAKAISEKMLGQTLVTKQTGPEGRDVSKVFIVKREYLRKESYFAILMDRANNGPVLVGSSEGGMDIETVAATNPDAIVKIPVDIKEGITQDQALRMAGALGFSQKVRDQAADQITKLYNFFIEHDCTQVEINPFAETRESKVMAMDAKFNFDDNAEFRHPDIFALRDRSQEDHREVAASKHNLNYIGLDGSIGCLVNGAGLAMSTMDIIQLHGGSPANFLDVGGGATEEQVSEAFKIITSDPRVDALLVNIFGGIMRCDVIAQGIINACLNLNLSIPLVVRLEGTRVEEAKKLIAESGLKIISADDLDDAAQKAVKMAEIVRMAKTVDVGVHFELPI